MTVEGARSGIQQYAGDINVHQAWDILKSNPNAILVDVRTSAEWAYVGLPDLSSLGKQVQQISWVLFPDMAHNASFTIDLEDSQPDPSAPVLFLCRSGVRSIAAAIAATNAGYKECYNILEGFEGNLDAERHRGTTGGWKAEKLAWVQG